MTQKTISQAEVTNNEIRKLVKAVRRNRVWIAAREEKNHAMAERLRELLAERGENWSDESGYARLVEASTRVSYDSKSIDQLIAREPETFACLSIYRKQSVIRASIQVK